jgi:hypothetical protein
MSLLYKVCSYILVAFRSHSETGFERAGMIRDVQLFFFLLSFIRRDCMLKIPTAVCCRSRYDLTVGWTVIWDLGNKNLNVHTLNCIPWENTSRSSCFHYGDRDCFYWQTDLLDTRCRNLRIIGLHVFSAPGGRRRMLLWHDSWNPE